MDHGKHDLEDKRKEDVRAILSTKGNLILLVFVCLFVLSPAEETGALPPNWNMYKIIRKKPSDASLMG